MELIKDNIILEKVKDWENCFSPNGENLAKVVVDIEKEIFVIGGFLHADEEEFLLDEGSSQDNLWGINLYSSQFGSDLFIEFDSMINIRPNQNNRSRGVENLEIRNKITNIIDKMIIKNA